MRIPQNSKHVGLGKGTSLPATAQGLASSHRLAEARFGCPAGCLGSAAPRGRAAALRVVAAWFGCAAGCLGSAATRKQAAAFCIATAVVLLLAGAQTAQAQTGQAQAGQGQMPQALPEQPLISEKGLTKVSEHVYAIVGWPNIGIVVGDRATLVIDTGLGERNGATIMRVEQKLAKGPILYLTTTHYHSEHVTGEQAFPANTILIRPVVQQEELKQRLPGHMARFRVMSQQNKELLADVRMRTPDILSTTANWVTVH